MPLFHHRRLEFFLSAPSDGVDPKDEDEDEDDRLLVLDQPTTVAVLWVIGGAGAGGGQAGGVLQLENLEQLLWGKNSVKKGCSMLVGVTPMVSEKDFHSR